MPKRYICGDSIARSKKLRNVQPVRYRAELALLLTLGLGNGTFECDPILVHRDLYSYNRPDISVDDVEAMFNEFERTKLLFRFQDKDGTEWGWWTGSDKPGRLMAESLRGRYKQGATLPKDKLARFMAEKPADEDGNKPDSTNLVATSRVPLEVVLSHSRVGQDLIKPEENRIEKKRREETGFAGSAIADENAAIAAHAADAATPSFFSLSLQTQSNGQNHGRGKRPLKEGRLLPSGTRQAGQVNHSSRLPNREHIPSGNINQDEASRDYNSRQPDRDGFAACESGISDQVNGRPTDIIPVHKSGSPFLDDRCARDPYEKLRQFQHPLRITDEDFDPLDYAFTRDEEFAGFSPAELQRIMWYHWRGLPPHKRWWVDRGIKSILSLKKSLPTMAKQVPPDFRVITLHRHLMISDPDCPRCHGEGDTIETASMYPAYMGFQICVPCACMHEHLAPWRLDLDPVEA
jgi:hypothetical protein